MHFCDFAKEALPLRGPQILRRARIVNDLLLIVEMTTEKVDGNTVESATIHVFVKALGHRGLWFESTLLSLASLNLRKGKRSDQAFTPTSQRGEPSVCGDIPEISSNC